MKKIIDYRIVKSKDLEGLCNAVKIAMIEHDKNPWTPLGSYTHIDRTMTTRFHFTQTMVRYEGNYDDKPEKEAQTPIRIK